LKSQHKQSLIGKNAVLTINNILNSEHGSPLETTKNKGGLVHNFAIDDQNRFKRWFGVIREVKARGWGLFLIHRPAWCKRDHKRKVPEENGDIVDAAPQDLVDPNLEQASGFTAVNANSPGNEGRSSSASYEKKICQKGHGTAVLPNKLESRQDCRGLPYRLSR
jgi:hypothetical protein